MTDGNEEGGHNEERIRIVDLNKMEDALNSMLLVCGCNINQYLLSFSEYCVENDPDLLKDKMERLLEGWKQRRELKNKK